MKVINALGLDHYSATLAKPSKTAEAYREHSLQHLNTAELCAAQGVAYEPLVFTCQGGCEAHAESILTRIATCIDKCEGVDAASVKAEMMESISLCIERSVARAIHRRATTRQTRKTQTLRSLEEAASRIAAEDE